MKNLLVITYYWPPSGGAGVQRILKFCKYLPLYGWNPIVLTSGEGDFPSIDTSLINDAKDIHVEKATGFSFLKLFKKITGIKQVPSHQLSSSKNETLFIRFSRWFRYNLVIPDGRISWYYSSYKKAKKIINEQNIDLIFSSSPPHSIHLVSKKLAKSFDIPWISDFRDPWTDRFYYYENPRNFFISYIDLLLEKSVLKNSDYIISASPGFLKLLTVRYPLEGKSSIIFNGFDPEDFINISKYNEQYNQNIKIGHIGSLSKSQNPKGLINSLQIFNNNASKVKATFECIGSVHSDIDTYAKEKNLNNYFGIESYLNHNLAIRKMCSFNFLVLVVPETEKNEGIIPAKVFEYIASGVDIICIGNLNSDVSNLLRKLGYDKFYTINEIIDFSKINLQFKSAKKDIMKYSRKVQTKELAKIFNQVTN